jgi:triosephosphate isomerase
MTKLIVANWKMNLNLQDSVKLATDYAKVFKKTTHSVVACPSFLALAPIAKLWSASKVVLGAQDAFWEAKGAYTGEVSAAQLHDLGCRYVILGHSERRQYLGESCRLINAKAKSALVASLTPIICVGENAVRRKAGNSITFVSGQVKRALAGLQLKAGQSLVIAYEPIWAIGTGQVIKPADAIAMHAAIRRLGLKILGPKANIKVIYGGSVDVSNASALLAQSEIDGFLVGGASLSAANFHKIANIK